jgi:hypothetical protein
MANFSAPALYNSPGTALKTAGYLWCNSANKRAMIYEIEMGQMGAYSSTDSSMQWDLSRAVTAAAAGVTVAANLLDTADYTSTFLFFNATTAEPTATTAGNGLNLKQWGINQRGSYRWRALDDGDNILIPGTVGIGIALRVSTIASGFAGSALGTISYVER